MKLTMGASTEGDELLAILAALEASLSEVRTRMAAVETILEAVE